MSTHATAEPGQAMFRNPPGIAEPVARYSHLAKVPAGGELLFIAGQVGNEADGRVGDDVAAQYEQALLNVVATLASEGLGPRELVKLTYLLVQPLDRELGATIRARVLGDAAPATTFAYVSALAKPEFLVEIDGIAVRTS